MSNNDEMEPDGSWMNTKPSCWYYPANWNEDGTYASCKYEQRWTDLVFNPNRMPEWDQLVKEISDLIYELQYEEDEEVVVMMVRESDPNFVSFETREQKQGKIMNMIEVLAMKLRSSLDIAYRDTTT